MRFNGTTIPTHRDETYDTSEVSRYKSSSSSDIEVEALDVTENGIYTAPDGKAYSPVTVNVSGGGGSSDFSTAHVTVSTNDSFYLSNSVILVDVNDVLITDVSFESNDYLFLLYKGEYEANIMPPDEMSITSATGSGGVSVSTSLFGYRVMITGDGTLSVTIS